MGLGKPAAVSLEADLGGTAGSAGRQGGGDALGRISKNQLLL